MPSLDKIPRNHSERLARQFFAMARELGYESMWIKDKAKKKFSKEHFNELTDFELNYLIGELSKIQYDRQTKETTAK
jgi:hypothetical protein